jgi:glycosyltransferase involved in cell wall biosynthesis
MTRRRVTVVSNELLGVAGTGGPGTADSLLAIALGRHGHDVELLLAPGRDTGGLDPKWEGVRIRPVSEKVRVEPSFLAPSAHVYAALRDDPPDLVVADDWRALPWAALRSRQVGRAFPDTAFVLYCHGPARVFAEAARKVPDAVERFGEEMAQRACVELADAVVSPSGWLIEWLRERGWSLGDAVHVIQNLWASTALGTTVTPAPVGPIRRLAFFGQLREGKGMRVFLEALRRVDVGDLELLFLGHSRNWAREQIERELGHEVRVETNLDQTGAIAELKVPGTLAVMPSLLENSPYAVAECIEHGIPFLAADVGGTPELVAPADRARVLHPPTPDAFARALERALVHGVEPARPAQPPQESLAAWLELVETVEPLRPQPVVPPERVVVVARGDASRTRARRLGVDVVEHVEQADADWVVLVDDDDVPDDTLVDELVAAQAASGADAVTMAVRPADDAVGLLLFLGEPGPLGLVENQYGVLGLVRRSLATEEPDWPLFARVALGGGRIVSIPDPLALHLGSLVDERPAVVRVFETAGPDALPQLPQLAATLAAALARRETSPPPVATRHLARGVARRLRGLYRRLPRRHRAMSVADPADTRPPLNVLHIGKTGGTALKHVLVEHASASRYQLLFRGHDVTLADLPKGEQYMFLIRDPLTRFVSAFNGRLREDRPRYHYPWREEERIAFARFKTPDQLAVALSSEDDKERQAAERAMRGIGHVNTPYTFWFPDESAFRARLDDLFFIGLQDQLDDDFESLKTKLGLAADTHLPRDETAAHKSPTGSQTQLSDVGRANLERWYERDIAFVQLCRELAPQINRA